MVTPEKSKVYTMEEFIEFALRPENSQKDFEFINGEIIEMTPTRTRNSGYTHLLTVAVHNHCREKKLPCYTSGEAGAYNVQGNTVAPDFAYKRTPLSDDYPDPEAPLWVLEVISPTDKAPDIRDKRQIYREAGILLWEMYPKRQSIDVYAPGKDLRTFGINDTLDGGDMLPEFKLPVRELFSQ